MNDPRVEVEGRRRQFTGRILLPDMRRIRKVAEVLPILYLRGLSTGDLPGSVAKETYTQWRQE